MALDVFFELHSGDRSVTELSEKYHAPLSTIQTIMKKLHEHGVVDKYKDPKDRRSTLYRLCRIPIFCDPCNSIWSSINLNDSTELFLSPKNIIRDLFIVLVKKLSENGMDTWPLLINMGLGLGDVPRPTEWLKKLPDETIEYSPPTFPDIKLRIDYKDSLILEIVSERKIDDLDLMLAGIGFGYLIKKIYLVTGKCYNPLVSVHRNDKGELYKFISEKKTYEAFLPPPIDDNVMEYTAPINTDVFGIYKIGDKSILIKNQMMRDILEILSHSNMNITEMEERLNKQRISIYSALHKLLDMGAVSVLDPESKRNTIYKLNCRKVLESERLPRNIENGYNQPIKDYYKDAEELCSNMVSFLEITYSKMGISLKDILMDSVEFIKTNINKKYENTPYDEVMDQFHFKDDWYITVINGKRRIRSKDKNKECPYVYLALDIILEDVLNPVD